jgi:cell division protein FtsW
MANLKQKLSRFLRPVKGEHEADKVLIGLIFVIVVFGLVSLSSATSVVAYDKFDGDAYYYFRNQLISLGIGMLAFIIFSKVDYHTWRRYAALFLFVSVLSLLLVFIPGLSADYGRARSWINIFGYSLQPSELVKISFLLYLAAWLETRKKQLHDLGQGIGPFISVLGIIGLLMILQPDIGTLSIIAVTSLIVFFVGGGSLKHLSIIIVIGGLLFTLLVQFNDYQLDRFRCVANPGMDPQKTCYQINQSLIAVGSGGLLGRGLGESRQKYMYLPEVSGDSIFAIIAEETGFFISSLLILLFFGLFWRGYVVAKRAPDDFGRILAIGIVSWLAIQAMVNIGGIIGLMPMTGVPLPLVSFGGTAVLATMSALGILVNISKHTR